MTSRKTPTTTGGNPVSDNQNSISVGDRHDHRIGNDDYTQPGNLFRLMSDDQKQQLFHNIAGAMEGVPEKIIRRQIVHSLRADPDYGHGVAKEVGIDISDLTSEPAMA